MRWIVAYEILNILQLFHRISNSFHHINELYNQHELLEDKWSFNLPNLFIVGDVTFKKRLVNLWLMAFIWITKTLHFNFKVRKELLSSTFVRSSYFEYYVKVSIPWKSRALNYQFNTWPLFSSSNVIEINTKSLRSCTSLQNNL